jgi:hypothetical protein
MVIYKFQVSNELMKIKIWKEINFFKSYFKVSKIMKKI